MKLAALSIGVSKAGSLPHLPGAVNGAKLFEAWARKNKYKVTCLVDDKKPISAKQISDAVDKIIKTSPDRLLIYFSGHGAQATVNTAYWLLSDWEEDSNEAINVSLSLSNAKRSGIAQVSVFADACRNVVSDVQSIGGQSIFPKKVISNKQPQWDQFFASRLGEISQEVPAKKHIKAFGIFSNCLMSALDGKADQAFVEVQGSKALRLTSQSLASFIDDEVPLQSGKTAGAALQIPETLPGWRSPNDFYVELKAPVQSRPTKAGVKKVAAKRSRSEPDSLRRSEKSKPPGKEYMQRSAAEQRAMKELQSTRLATSRAIQKRTDAIESAQGRASFETHMGLSIVGSEVDRIVTQPNGKIEMFGEGDTTHLRCFGDEPLQILIKLKSGNWLATACFPGLIGTILAERSSAASTSFYPSMNNSSWRDPRPIQVILARWMALSQHGLAPKHEELTQFADEVRQWKHANPSMGILAAYAYERAGNLQELKELSGYYAMVNQAVPFDVAYLPSLPMTKVQSHLMVSTVLDSAERQAKVAGHFPLMTQGWAYLDPHDKFLNPKLFAIRKGLVPSALWTSLRDTEGQQLATLLERGEL